MTVAGLTGLIILILILVCTGLFIYDLLFSDKEIRILPATITITGWAVFFIVLISYGLSNIDWSYKIF